MLIGELAGQLGINPKTIRYYEEIGLLPEPDRTESNYRVYGSEDRERLAFILRARQLEFSLDETREILSFREAGELPCPYVLREMERKIQEIEERMRGLERLRAELGRLKEDAEAIPAEERALRGRICHILENEALEAPGA